MNPFFGGIYNLINEIRNATILAIRQYISGYVSASSTMVSSLQAYIDKTAAATTNVIKSGVNDLIDATYIEGSVRVVSGTSKTTWNIMPNVKILQVSFIEETGSPVIVDFNGDAVYTTTVAYEVDGSTFAATKTINTITINSSFSAASTLNFTGNTPAESAITFIQPSTMVGSGVS